MVAHCCGQGSERRAAAAQAAAAARETQAGAHQLDYYSAAALSPGTRLATPEEIFPFSQVPLAADDGQCL